DAVVATTLPTREELRLLSAIAQPLVVALASQVPYLKSIATTRGDRKSTRLNSSHVSISYAVFCLKKKKKKINNNIKKRLSQTRQTTTITSFLSSLLIAHRLP